MGRFTKLPHVSVVRETGHTDGKSVFTVPDAGMFEADVVGAVLQDIADAHRNDLKECGGLRIGAMSNESWHFQRRSIGRLGAYVTFACTLDGLLRTVHGELLTIQKWIGVAPVAPLPDDLEKPPSPFGDWRNKVFAHTAYADPVLPPKSGKKSKRLPDNLGDRLTSLRRLSGIDISLLRGGDIRHGALEIGAPNTKIDQLGVLEAHRIMTTRLAAWAKELRSAVRPLAKAKLAKWKAWDATVTRVVRSNALYR